MIDIRTFCKRFMIGTAVVVAIVIQLEKMLEARRKWVLMGLFLIGIFEVFAYILAPLIYHSIYDKRK